MVLIVEQREDQVLSCRRSMAPPNVVAMMNRDVADACEAVEHARKRVIAAFDAETIAATEYQALLLTPVRKDA